MSQSNLEKFYSIRDLSEEFDVTPRTLRFYEEKSLVSPDRKGQQRLYSSADRTRLKLILRGRNLGFTLEESADIIGMYDPSTDNHLQLEALITKIREKRERLEQQRRDINQMIRDLNTWESRTQLALEKTTTGEPS